MHLTELKTFLNYLGVRPKKGLSQNFLIDSNIVTKIIKESAIKTGDSVLEIGSGPGILTKALADAGAQVVAVELDKIFIKTLECLPVTVYESDILQFPLDRLKTDTKVVSNLPYHLTAPILTRLVKRRDLFSTLTVVLQEEVARRIIAKPQTSDYGSLTVFLNFYATARYAFQVSRHCFYPAPSVDSAVVTLTLKEPPAVDSERFFRLVRTAFQQRRKMLKNSLASLYDTTIDLTSRPEELSLEAFLTLFHQLEKDGKFQSNNTL